MKSFLSVLLLLTLTLTLAFSQQYDFRAPVRCQDLTITGTVYIIADGETLSVFTADSLVKLVLVAGRITGTDVVVTDTLKGKKGVFTDSVKAPTVDATGKITGGANLAITGTGAFSGILSPLSVTLPGGGTIADPASPGTTVTITETNIALAGAVTATTAAVGASGTALIKIVVVGDSLAFITATDTMWAWQPGTK